MKQNFIHLIATIGMIFFPLQSTDACTGISLKSGNGNRILARTIEWGGSNLNSQYIIVPRQHLHQTFTLQGKGMRFTNKFGYVGLAVEQKEFIAEGINEAGLSAGLFYFPGYGAYETFDERHRESSISDLQLVFWMLGNFSTIAEIQEAISAIHITAIAPHASTVHWRIADRTGRQVVLEIINGKLHFYENKVGVLTNSPGFEWQLTNLNNYVNLYPGSAENDHGQLESWQIRPFGAGSGFLGLPGDVTPPSRFVRAAFYQATAPQLPTAEETVMQSFQILNNFDIPIGIEFKWGEKPTNIPSATQWTSSTDIDNLKIYYRTMYNSTIRCIDLKNINFQTIAYQVHPLDSTQQPIIEKIQID